MNSRWKKRFLMSIPYLILALLAAKLGEGWRLAPGVTASAKVLHLALGISHEF